MIFLLMAPSFVGAQDMTDHVFNTQKVLNGYEEESANSKIEHWVYTGFVAGVLNGMQYMNIQAADKGAPIYCQPPKLVFTSDNLISAINRTMEESDFMRELYAETLFDIAAGQELKKIFPCE